MKEEFRILSDREHILHRAGMYIGGTSPEVQTRFLFGKTRQVEFAPGLIKITNELVDNSVDEHIRSGFRKATRIEITMTDGSFCISDNGRGIPVETIRGEPRPKLAWCTAKAGTSFDDLRVGAGANGVGSVCSNVFSEQFIGTTCDGNRVCVVTCSGNMMHTDVSDRPATPKDPVGTKVFVKPDFSRFGVSGYTETDKELIRNRLALLSATYPKIRFFFNGEAVRFRNPDEYLGMFGDSYVMVPFQNGFLGFFPSGDEYLHCTSIDGLELTSGGTHEMIVSRELSYVLRELIRKKYRLEMTPAEIKRGLLVVLVGKNFTNMKFNSQTKEQLTNTEAETKKWLGEIDWASIGKAVLRNEEIIQPIIANKLAKQQAAEARAVTLAQKKLAKKNIPEYVEAQGRKPEEKILFLTEGRSAAGMGIKVRDTKKHGFFPLKGVPLNTYGKSQKEILDNKELANVMSILGLSFGMSDQDVMESITYRNIGILCDADIDGTGAIFPLLLCFFWRWKVLFDAGIVKFVRSPIHIFTKGRGESSKRVYCYTPEEYERIRGKYSSWEHRYIKGLGSLREYEYRDVINDPENLITVTIDDPDCFRTMFSTENVEERRKIMEI